MPRTKVPLSAGAILPKDMDPRQWAEFLQSQSTHYIRSGQTAYDTGTGIWFGDDNGTIKFSVGDSAGNKVTWNGSVLAITGTVTATLGTIGGWTLSATALTAGSGANTVGLDSGGTNPAFYAGSATPASAPFRVTQAGALFASSANITGEISADSLELSGAAQTFTPTWAGFLTDPAGDLSYIDLGNFAIIFSADARTNTSDDVVMSLTGVPAAIRSATSAGTTVTCYLINNGSTAWGMVNIDNAGGMQFFIFDGTAPLPFDDAGFTNSGGKGLPAGFFVMYPK